MTIAPEQPGQAVGAFPVMPDPAGAIWADVEELKPKGPINETPRGRFYGIHHDEWLLYREMYCLLTDPPPVPPGAIEDRLQDCTDQLPILQQRQEDEFWAIMAARWGW